VGTIDTEALAADRDQLFAEAVGAYRSNELWWPNDQFERDHIRTEQEARFEVDAWEPAIACFIAGRDRIQVSEVARGALEISAAKIGTAEQRRISRVLNRLGWEQGKREASGRWYVHRQSLNDA
jgi:predicted P-loop ATPase